MPQLKTLSSAQTKRLQQHKKNHSEKHMKSMRMSMMRGMSFAEAHRKAMRVGGH